jgi:hypothetical protein
MSSPWHDGERAVQRRVGEVVEAERTAAGIQQIIPEVAAEFLAHQPMLIVAATAADGLVWASLVTGPPGFLQVPFTNTLVVDAQVPPGDPLAATLAEPALVGTLAIEPRTRRRSRVNGLARPTPDGFLVEPHQVYANCPKYIQRRAVLSVGEGDGVVAAPTVTDALLPHQQRWLATADTFFMATTDVAGNADASHRGGNPGFVEVVDAGRFRFPDYPGNSMYMTLGNLEQQPAAGFLFVAWTTGTTLQVTGRAHVDFAGERTVTVDVSRVIETPSASPLRWGPPTPSRYNPPTDRSQP